MRAASVLSASLHLCVRSVCVSVVGRKRVQVAQLAKAALDVRHMDLNVILEATEEPKKKREKAACQNRFFHHRFLRMMLRSRVGEPLQGFHSPEVGGINGGLDLV